MKKYSFIFIFFFSVSVFAQQKADTTQKSKTEPGKISNIKTGPGTSGTDTITDTGVAIAPSTMNFRTKPGKSETILLTITNDQKRSEKFKITFQDFTMDNMGKTSPVAFGEITPYGLSSYILAAPTVVELRPGEKKKIPITVSMPETDIAYRASWTMMMIDRINERPYILPPNSSDKTMQMGVIPTYGFGVHIFQNPPNVKINKVEITSFKFTYDDTAKYVTLKVKNSGDGMGYCKSYIELNNLKTGKIQKHLLKQFVVFPGLERNFEIMVPGKIEKGQYSVLLVLDFGSKEQIEAAELEVTVN